MAEPVQTDAQGRRYIDYPGQGRVYISPVSFGGEAPADPGPWKNRHWNPRSGKWETKIDWTLPASLAVGGVMAAPAVAGAIGAGGAAGASGGAAGATGAAGTASVASGVATGLGGTLLRYGLQYGVPVVGSLIAGKMAANAERDSNAALMGYYDKALEAEQEERTYRRGWDEEDRRYGRYGDLYGRESDEERLAYDRSQTIRDKNYGYQQYGNFVETLEPFRAGGSAAASRMSGLMGGPRTPDTGSYANLANTARQSVQAVPQVPGRPTWNYEERSGGAGQTPAAAATTQPSPVSTTMPVGGSPALVAMESPDGERREVPAAMVASLEALGAKRVS